MEPSDLCVCISSSKSDKPEPKSEPESSSSEPLMTSRIGLLGGGAKGDDTRASSCDEKRPRDTRLRMLVSANELGNIILLRWWLSGRAGRRTSGTYKHDMIQVLKDNNT